MKMSESCPLFTISYNQPRQTCISLTSQPTTKKYLDHFIKSFTLERLSRSSISLKMVLPAAMGASGIPSVLSCDDLVLARNGLPEALVLTPEKVTE